MLGIFGKRQWEIVRGALVQPDGAAQHTYGALFSMLAICKMGKNGRCFDSTKQVRIYIKAVMAMCGPKCNANTPHVFGLATCWRWCCARCLSWERGEHATSHSTTAETKIYHFFVFYFLNKNLVAAEPIPFNSMVVAFVSESGKQICNIFSFTDRASLSNMTHRRYAVWWRHVHRSKCRCVSLWLCRGC